jgi:hypothetical protein
VGFQDYIVERATRIAVIPASGEMTWPHVPVYGDAASKPASQLFIEKQRIPEYMSGERHMHYEYWYSRNGITTQDELDELEMSGSNPNGGTYFTNEESESVFDGVIEATTQFTDYPLDFPMRAAFTSSSRTDITGEAAIMNYSDSYPGGFGPGYFTAGDSLTLRPAISYQIQDKSTDCG